MNYKSIIVSAILLISIMGFIAPAVPALASTGHAQILIAKYPYLNSTGQELFNVSNFVQVKGGTDQVVSSPSGYLAYNLTGVTFSGSQFFLYISTNGLSEICLGPNNPAGCTSADFEFAGPFNVADLSSPPKILSNGFSIGKFNSTTVALEGPIPRNLSAGNYYIKFFDGTSTSVAVTAQYIQIVPNLLISPAAGPAGASVTVTGYGYTAGGTVNITFNPKVDTSVNVTASSTGGFNYTFTAGYLGSPSSPMIYDNFFTLSPPNGLQLNVIATDTKTSLSASATYTEYYRNFQYILSYNPSGVVQPVSVPLLVPPLPPPPPYPNGSSVNGYVLQKFDIAGNFWNPTQNLTFTFDGTPITPVASSGAPNATGYFWANFTLPISSLGIHNFRVIDANTNMSILINIQTTLIVTPQSGPEGTTVSLTGYGFHSSAGITAWWFGTSFSAPVNADASTEEILLYNATTSAVGSFTATFKVPSNVYGGLHTILANDSKNQNATVTFYVTPTFSSTPSTAPLGSNVMVSGSGLPAGSTNYQSSEFPNVNTNPTGAPVTYYETTYDNSFNPNILVGNDTGAGNVTLVAAGVPMVHYIAVYKVFYFPPSTSGPPVAILSLNVTGSTNEGSQIMSLLNSVLSNQNNEMTVLNNILSQSKANGAAIANVSSQVQGVSGQVSSLSNSVSSLSSAVSSGFQSTSSSLSGISSTLSSVQSQTSQIPTVSGNLGNVSTYLIVAIVLAAIVLILEIVILVRKK
jgi:hypothetical protein